MAICKARPIRHSRIDNVKNRQVLEISTCERRPPMSKPVVLITGALTGIGRATALAFAKLGARVVVSGRRDDAGAALVVELRALGAEAAFVRADVRHED